MMISKKEKKKIWKERLAYYKKQPLDLQAYVARNYEINDNRVTISLQVSKFEDLLSPWSSTQQIFLNASFLADLESYVEPIPKYLLLTLELAISNLTPQQKQLLTQELQDYYAFKLYQVQQKQALNKRKVIGLTILGFLLLVGYFFLELLTSTRFFTEFLSIAGTFALWEVADFWFLERNALKMDVLILGQLATMNLSIHE